LNRLAGRTALVTGASRGIGRAIALELAKAGARVALNYRSGAEHAEEVAEQITAAGGKAMLVRADVGNKDEARAMIAKVLAKWEHLDILVNNAGVTRDVSLKKMTDEDWSEVINTNLNSVFYCTGAVLKSMSDQKFGRIVNVASVVGQAGNFGQGNYSASKGAVIAFTKTAALELARYNVTVNVIAPGFTDTDMFAKVTAEAKEQILSKIPIRRFGKPEEIARAVLFLCTDGDYITGQQLNVNGGIYM